MYEQVGSVKGEELVTGNIVQYVGFYWEIENVERFKGYLYANLVRGSTRGLTRKRVSVSYKNVMTIFTKVENKMDIETLKVAVETSIDDLGIKLQSYLDSRNLDSVIVVAPTVAIDRIVIVKQTHKEMMAEFNKLAEYMRQF